MDLERSARAILPSITHVVYTPSPTGHKEESALSIEEFMRAMINEDFTDSRSLNDQGSSQGSLDAQREGIRRWVPAIRADAVVVRAVADERQRVAPLGGGFGATARAWRHRPW